MFKKLSIILEFYNPPPLDIAILNLSTNTENKYIIEKDKRKQHVFLLFSFLSVTLSQLFRNNSCSTTAACLPFWLDHLIIMGGRRNQSRKNENIIKPILTNNKGIIWDLKWLGRLIRSKSSLPATCYHP